MSATWSTYGRQMLMAGLLTPDIYVPPPGLWCALLLAAPHINDDVSMLIEPVGGGYYRAVVPLGSANWLLSSPEEYTNANGFTFAEFTAGQGLCQGWAFLDSALAGAGNVWVVGSVVEPFMLDEGDNFVFDMAVLGLYD